MPPATTTEQTFLGPVSPQTNNDLLLIITDCSYYGDMQYDVSWTSQLLSGWPPVLSNSKSNYDRSIQSIQSIPSFSDAFNTKHTKYKAYNISSIQELDIVVHTNLSFPLHGYRVSSSPLYRPAVYWVKLSPDSQFRWRVADEKNTDDSLHTGSSTE